jgi:RpiB/LacA/LacB family sugar-phosphate isomerase
VKKIYAASDHAGVTLRRWLADSLRQEGHEVIDLGPETESPCDYPDQAVAVGGAVAADQGSVGLLVCGSGMGVAMAANKIPGIRAALPWNVESAKLSRSHNDANVLCLGARLLSESEAGAITRAWLDTTFEGGRHLRRVEKMTGIEARAAQEIAASTEHDLLEARDVLRRIWDRDPRAFTADTTHDSSIKNRLGWLGSIELVNEPERRAAVERFAAEVKGDGIEHVILLGMGGSSLCPEVLAATFGSAPGWPALRVLDNTDPEAVAAAVSGTDPARTLFLVASKSGGTIEVRSFESHFWAQALARAGGNLERAGRHFVAITDPGTTLEAAACEKRYRAIFQNPADIGGRYSALSYFGVVPAALLGIDLAALLSRAQSMAAACRELRVANNPGAELGARLGALQKQGRNKLTLLASPELTSLGSWIEQLVAESTGKQGRGIVPVDLERLGPIDRYGPDRVFVVITLRGGQSPIDAAGIAALRGEGHPVIEIELADRYDVGAEFFRWEFATAIAGACAGINPFDEPNVTEAKDATGRLLETWTRDRKFPPVPAGEAHTGDRTALRGALAALLAEVRPRDYFALCAFFRRTARRDDLLAAVRTACRDRLAVATTVGYGPRFLHSTGQLHKGGANEGVFLQVVAHCADGADIAIPNEPFSFAVLRDAQALGDFQVLARHRRRALRVALGADVDGGLEALLAAVSAPASR